MALLPSVFMLPFTRLRIREGYHYRKASMPKVEIPPLDELAARAGKFLFQDLIQMRVHQVLLVSTPYDHFILSQDGRLNEHFMGEFLELNLQHTPNLTPVFSGEEALQLARDQERYNLLITSIALGDMNVIDLVTSLRAAGIETPVIVLCYDRGELAEFLDENDVSGIERFFLWQGDVRILLAIVKYMEDKMNADYDVGVAEVPAIILVEDNIRYYSSFLPVIYTELVKHSQSLMPEGLNLTDKLMRIRARPKILLADHYEEAWSYFERFSDNILGVISDIQFPREGRSLQNAGVLLAKEIRKVRPDVPVMLQSSRFENAGEALEVGASFLLKGSPVLLYQLRRFMVESLRIGDFVFRLPDETEVGRASDMKELEELLERVPAESLVHHAARNDFSTWLKVRTEFTLADRLRPRKVTDFATPEELREHVIHAIAEYRNERIRGQIVDFDPDHFDHSAVFYRIGGGSLGGKARGLAFINSLLNQYPVDRYFPGVHIAVPTSVVVGTEVFDRFMEDNDLTSFALQCDDGEQIQARFQSARVPDEFTRALKAFLEFARYPLAVRSSSLLEDSQYQPFAGVYDTFMIPNNHPDIHVRLAQLIAAILRVYASTFSRSAKTFLEATQYRLEEEKMAVIIQRVVGRQHQTRFYPHFAGVARSHNYYPSPPATKDDGIAAVALGLGETVVSGGRALRFSPRYPLHLTHLSSVRDAVESSQRQFYALALDASDELDVSAELRTWRIENAEKDGTLDAVASTYSPDNDAVYDGMSRDGVRLVTFAPVLKQEIFPLAAILDTLLQVAERGTRLPVELEFAVNLRPPKLGGHEFGFLQLRPLALSRELEEVSIGNFSDDALVCRSKSVLGHGTVDDLYDVVVVDYDRLKHRESARTAELVARLNETIKAQGKTYLLVGVGRIGSRDPFLGIPVTWPQISAARCIIEAGFPDFRVTPSQGTHFFQNLTANDVGYFTVNPDHNGSFVDFRWLAEQEACFEQDQVRHLRFDSPLTVTMNGNTGEGIVLKPGSRDRASE
jgi:CheY-like chemotaxis protein